MLKSALACALTLVALETSHATATEHVFLSNGQGGLSPTDKTGATHAENMIELSGGNASALADVPSGTQYVNSMSPNIGSSGASSSIDEAISFGAGASGIAYLTYHLWGNISSLSPSSSSGINGAIGFGDGGALNIYITSDRALIPQRYIQFTNLAFDPHYPTNCTTVPNAVCTTGTRIDHTGVLPFNLVAGTFNLYSQLSALTGNGRSADFHADLFLSVPAGVTYVTGLPAVTLPVPEPAIGSLMLLGLLATCLRSSRSGRVAKIY